MNDNVEADTLLIVLTAPLWLPLFALAFAVGAVADCWRNR